LKQELAGTDWMFETLPPDMVIPAQVLVRSFHHTELNSKREMRR
jgi:hypothetical protein